MQPTCAAKLTIALVAVTLAPPASPRRAADPPPADHAVPAKLIAQSGLDHNVPQTQPAPVPVGDASAADADASDAMPADGLAIPDDQDVHLNPTGLLEIHVRNAALADVLRMISVETRRNISISPSVRGAVTVDLYGVTLEDALDAIVAPAGLTWFERDRMLYVCSPQEREQIERAGGQTELRVFELDYVRAADVAPVVAKLLSPAGQIVTTPDSPVPGIALDKESFDEALRAGLGGKSRATGELLIVRDYPDVLEDVARVVARLDARPRQVLIEVVILRARLDENNALGIDFNALAGIDFRTVSAVSTGGQDLTLGQVPPVALDSELGSVQTHFRADVPPGGLSVGIMANNVGLFIRALEDITDVTVVANTKVLAVNEQPGRVIVGREDGYRTTTVTQTAAVQDVQFLETGTQILFRPFITSDGYIRMDVHPEDSSGGLTQDNLPFKDTTEVTTNVVVKDGHTLVIGGLFRELTSDARRQIPWLGNLPLVGPLFRSDNSNVVREEVIVLITPHIVTAEHERLADKARDEIEQHRVLAHQGLMPWGRERLAHAHYRWALEHLRAGRRDKALLELNMALAILPVFPEAARLRDQLTGESLAEPDHSIIRDLLAPLRVHNPPATQPAPAGGPNRQPPVETQP